ncbi:MAG: transketolase [Candidatus Accumulibacter sp. BA-94]|nr:MAG: transketolase [Candidatus Accumulibacter sp. BA-94]
MADVTTVLWRCPLRHNPADPLAGSRSFRSLERSRINAEYVGRDGAVVGIDRFGEPAAAGQWFDFFGFTVTHLVSTVRSLLSFLKETVS